ncbi:MAG: glycoside hydrolase family 32 protein [Cyclobacteriaceae bacterium]
MKNLILFLFNIALAAILLNCNPETKSPIEMPIGNFEWAADQPVPKSVIQNTRAFRERLLEDPYRPAYHFTVPEDNGVPGDPNGTFYYNGRYHLMYLYLREGAGFAWGHVSSNDLLHWRHHPDAIGEGKSDDGPGNQEDGVFSGGAFVDDDGKAVITYWQFVNGNDDPSTFEDGKFGISIAESTDEHFDNWTKIQANPVIPSTDWGITTTTNENGDELIYGSADPSQIWKKDGRYYMLTGNLLVLRKYGLGPDARDDSVKYQGDHLYLFVSDDLEKWEYVHEFYERNPEWTAKTEDNMCPSFLPLPSRPDGGPPSDKHLLLFISHNIGCQYYVGSYRDDKFYADNHGRMTWTDNDYFAPEAMIDGQGRQIMWAWLHDGIADSLKDTPRDERWANDYYGWTGTYGLPRSLWLGEDGTLRMRPVKELEQLRINEKTADNLTIEGDTEMALDGFGHELLEMEVTIEPGSANQAGVMIGCSKDGREQTALVYDATEKQLKVDATRSSLDTGVRSVEAAPFELKAGEPLVLRIFVDRSVVEVYANDRQAIGRRIYPRLGGTDVKVFAKGGDAKVISVKRWEMMPSNPY